MMMKLFFKYCLGIIVPLLIIISCKKEKNKQIAELTYSGPVKAMVFPHPDFQTIEGSRKKAEVLSFTDLKALEEQQIEVHIDEDRQKFLGTGGSCGLYIEKWLNMSAANRALAANMIAKDVHLAFIKNYMGESPEDNPKRYDDFASYYKDVRYVNPEIKVQITVNNLPDHLEQRRNNGEVRKGFYDENISGVFDSIAHYYFRVLNGYKERDIQVDQLDIVNEPGEPGTGPNSRAVYKGRLFSKCVPKLKQLIDDPSININGVKMPQIVGVSTISPLQPLGWFDQWEKYLPSAFGQIDVVSTHGYREAWHESRYRDIKNYIGNKPFMNNEQTGRLQYGDPLEKIFGRGEEPGYIGDVSIAMRISDNINGGVNYFFAFLLNNPKGNNAALIKTKPGSTPEKSLIYDGFKQLTSLQPLGSSVLGKKLTNTGDNRVLCFRKGSEDTVYVHYTNITSEKQNFSIRLTDQNKPVDIKRAKAWVSNKDLDDEVVLDENYGENPVEQVNFTAEPFSVNSFKITLDESSLGMGKVQPDHTFSVFPNPFQDQFLIRGISSAGKTSLGVHDVSGRLVYSSSVDQNKNLSQDKLSIETSDWSKGVYFLTINSNGRHTVKKMIKH